MSVRECQERIDSREFTEWLAFYQLEPFGDEWRQSAQQTALLYNVNRGKQRAAKVEEFMPVRRVKPRQSNEQMHAVFSAFVKQHNARCEARRGANGGR